MLVELPVDHAVRADLVIMADEMEKFLAIATTGTPISDEDECMRPCRNGDRYPGVEVATEHSGDGLVLGKVTKRVDAAGFE